MVHFYHIFEIVSVTLLLSIHFVLLGYRSFKPINENTCLRIGGSFFVGMAYFLILWAIVFLLQKNAKFALYIALALSFFAYIAYLKQVTKITRVTRDIVFNYSVICIIFLFFYFIYLYLSLVPIPEEVIENNFIFDPWAGGTVIVHGFRAVNISLEASINNIFPIMKQNVGQSALIEILQLLKIKGAFLQLITWMTFSLAAFFVLICGFFKKFHLSNSRAIQATLMLFFGAQGLSLTYHSFTDTGTTIFFIRNLDVLIGLGIFIVLLNETLEITEVSYEKEVLLKKLVFICALLLSLSIISGHIIILYILSLFFIVFLEKYLFKFIFPDKKEPSYNFTQNIVLFPVILIAGYFSLKLFGFKTFLNVNITSLSDVSSNTLSLRNFPKVFVWPNTAWYQHCTLDDYFTKIGKLLLPDFFNFFSRGGYFEGFLGLKIIFYGLFFCILGFFIFLALAKSKFSLGINNQTIRFYLVSFALFITGGFISSFVDYGSNTRELTRFWLAGIFFGSFFLVYSSFYIFSSLASNKKIYIVVKSLIASFLVYTLIAPLLEISRWSYGNYTSDFIEGNYFGQNLNDGYNRKTLDLNSRLYFFLNYDDLFKKNN